MIPSAEDFSPELVMCRGRILSEKGRSLVEPRKVTFPDDMYRMVKVDGSGLALSSNTGEGEGDRARDPSCDEREHT